jgi:hypothetical protein
MRLTVSCYAEHLGQTADNESLGVRTKGHMHHTILQRANHLRERRLHPAFDCRRGLRTASAVGGQSA